MLSCMYVIAMCHLLGFFIIFGVVFIALHPYFFPSTVTVCGTALCTITPYPQL